MRTEEFAYALPDISGTTTLGVELARIGYLGKVAASYRQNPLSVHYELHIEQHTRLEKANKVAGIVNYIQGIRWYQASVTGTQAHAGSTPMDQRADAMVAAAKMVVILESIANKRHGFATVGKISGKGMSSNTISGAVMFTIDLRHSSEHTLDAMESEMKEAMVGFTSSNPKLVFEVEKVWESPAAKMDVLAMDCLRAAAKKEVGPDNVLELMSFAGHDSALTATKIPTAMLFVPSKDGISHAPTEYTSKKHW